MSAWPFVRYKYFSGKLGQTVSRPMIFLCGWPRIFSVVGPVTDSLTNKRFLLVQPKKRMKKMSTNHESSSSLPRLCLGWAWPWVKPRPWKPWRFVLATQAPSRKNFGVARRFHHQEIERDRESWWWNRGSTANVFIMIRMFGRGTSQRFLFVGCWLTVILFLTLGWASNRFSALGWWYVEPRNPWRHRIQTNESWDNIWFLGIVLLSHAWSGLDTSFHESYRWCWD
jgi:hypothetical protein